VGIRLRVTAVAEATSKPSTAERYESLIRIAASIRARKDPREEERHDPNEIGFAGDEQAEESIGEQEREARARNDVEERLRAHDATVPTCRAAARAPARAA